MSNRAWLATYIGALFASFLAGNALCGWYEDTDEADRSVAEAETPADASVEHIATTPQDLVRAYARNEWAADYAFKGKRIELTGVAGPIHQELGGQGGYLMLADGEQTGEVLARLDAEQSSALTELAAGEAVTVRCQLWGKMIFVVLEECSLVRAIAAR